MNVNIHHRRLLIHLALILVCAVLPYLNTFAVPFVFDDSSNILENPVIHDLQRFLGGDGWRYNPRRFVGYLTLALNLHFGGFDVFGFHVVNLVIHSLTALLVYALVRLTFRTPLLQASALRTHSPLIALAVALLFAVHPVQTQAVTYIVQRFAALAALFYLLSLVLYAWGRIRATHDAGATHASPLRVIPVFIGSFIAAVLALLTKEIAITLPLAILLYEVTFFRAAWRRRLTWLLPVLVVMAIISLGLVASFVPHGTALSSVDLLPRDSILMSRSDYLFTQCRVLVTYLRLLFLPVNQNLDYDYPVYHTFFTPPVLLSFLLLLSLVLLVAWLYWSTGSQRSVISENGAGGKKFPFTIHHSLFTDPALRLIAFGLLWFFLTLLIESSLIPLRDVIFEHRLYLPSIGIVLAVVVTLALALRRRSRLFVAVIALCVVVLAITTWQRNQVWQDGVTLWGDTVARSPAKGRPIHNYAMALAAAGETQRAIEQFQRALQVGSPTVDTLVNLAVAYEKAGQSTTAEKYFRWALAEEPAHVKALTRLAILLLQRSATAAEGLGLLRQAQELQPKNANVQFNLGVAFEAQGSLEQAVLHYRRAVDLEPGYARAHNALGIIAFRQGRFEPALAHFQAAIDADPALVDAYINQGVIHRSRGRHDLAEQLFRQADQAGR